MTLHFGSTCQLVFEVENAAGERVYPHGGCGCGLMLTEMHLAPGESRTASLLWTGDRSRYPHEGREPSPAGEYRVFGILGAQGELRSEPEELILVQPLP